jgi:16S rRNA (cytidine1402-2'-O)-methyltransferase
MGELVLVPTPLNDSLPLEPVAFGRLLMDALDEGTILLVEEHKIGRQRWLKWGLPREAIEKFILFNEHTQQKIQSEIIGYLKNGKKVYLLSDCGLPAFCDPGQKLVDACHKAFIKVTSTPFPNSIALSLALSGFSHESFVFSGFIPVKEPERSNWMKKELKRPETLIWMETPYRLEKLLEDLGSQDVKRELFMAIDLSGPEEKLIRGKIQTLRQILDGVNKKEFVLIVAPSHP